ncbi:MAG: hypothetical protein ISS18_15080 [Bacteroidales bacterium]|nr:hypothetical protein [Bacteroidales bacterium]
MDRKTKVYYAAFGVLAIISIFCFNCRHYDIQPFPDPAAGCAFFTQDYALPQTQTAQQLAEYLSSEHFEYDLDGWFFFGSLVDSAMPDDIGVFFIAVQRIEESLKGFRVPMVPAIVGFNSASLGHYEFRGFLTLDMDPLMTVTSNPWSVRLNSPLQSGPLIKMDLVSGSMGAADAVYNLTADIPDSDGVRLQAEVQFRDRLGVVNQGDGSASFFAQFLTDAQRKQIMGSSVRTVSNYLEATDDPMSCQGSYYYSLPLMDVEQFSIILDTVSLSNGSDGFMWMDYVVQSYDQRARDVFSNASWDFYAIQLPEENAAIMVIQVNSATGSLPIAKLFRYDSDRTLNFARKAVHSWAIDEIKIEAIGTTWTSPTTGLKYAMHHRIQLMSTVLPADLIINMMIENQEIVIDFDTIKTIKYEGLGSVEGMLGDLSVTGRAFVELQPVGHLK